MFNRIWKWYKFRQSLFTSWGCRNCFMVCNDFSTYWYTAGFECFFFFLSSSLLCCVVLVSTWQQSGFKKIFHTSSNTAGQYFEKLCILRHYPSVIDSHYITVGSSSLRKRLCTADSVSEYELFRTTVPSLAICVRYSIYRFGLIWVKEVLAIYIYIYHLCEKKNLNNNENKLWNSLLVWLKNTNTVSRTEREHNWSVPVSWFTSGINTSWTICTLN